MIGEDLGVVFVWLHARAERAPPSYA
jgi:hypothetical protein